MSTSGLSTTCTACGTTRKRQTIMYDPATLEPYCPNIYVCGEPEKHPNSVKNILDRGGDLELMPYDQALQAFEKELQKTHTAESIEFMRKLLTRPLNFRLNDTAMAQYLMDLQEKADLPDMTNTIRWCIQYTMKNFKLPPTKADFEARDKEHDDFHKAMDSEAAQTTTQPVQEDDDDEFTV